MPPPVGTVLLTVLQVAADGVRDSARRRERPRRLAAGLLMWAPMLVGGRGCVSVRAAPASPVTLRYKACAGWWFNALKPCPAGGGAPALLQLLPPSVAASPRGLAASSRASCCM